MPETMRFPSDVIRKKKFDPEGEGFDDEGFEKSGGRADSKGKKSSRDPKTGLIFKGRKHPTFHKTLEAEKKLGFEVFKGKDGRYYSRRKK